MTASAVVKSPAPFGTTAAGETVDEYLLTNPAGASVTVITFGGIITKLIVPDRADTPADVVLGFDTLEAYEKNSSYFGAAIGRVGNRIASGEFAIDGKFYHVPVNNGPNSLHGGVVGYDKRNWQAEVTGDALKLSLVDPDGSEGYPGTVCVSIVYALTAENVLRLTYDATTDQPTPINLTNHSYFNLKDAGRSSVAGHVVRIEADRYTSVDSKLIPTGDLPDVVGTPFDFTVAKPIGRDLQAVGGVPIGFDHNFVLRDASPVLRKAATVSEPVTGRTLEIWTTEPGVQFYTGNFLDGSITGKGGAVYHQHHGFCLETQHFPDSVNHPAFPNTILRPGQKFKSTTEFRFGKA